MVNCGGAGSGLDLSMFRKRMHLSPGHDEMVEDAHVDQRQRLRQRAREQQIRFAGLGRAGRVVVGEHDAGRVVQQCLLDHFARIHAGVREGAAKHFLGRDQAVLDVQKQHVKRFMRQVAQSQAQIIFDRVRRIEGLARLQVFDDGAPRQFQHGLQLGELGAAHAVHGGKTHEAGAKQAPQGAEVLDRVARQFHGALAAHARAQEHGQQLRVRQRLRAILDQAFARPFAGWPILDAQVVLLFGTDACPSTVFFDEAMGQARPVWLTISFCTSYLKTTMSNEQPAVVTEAAYLTLHYRLATVDGTDIVTTFSGNPATLMLGQGQLAPFLEQRLLGLPEGTHQTFELAAGEGFGERNPELVQSVSRATLDENSVPGADYKIGDLVDFAAPGGGRFAGVLREMRDDSALFDFNHPLAGQPLRFEVKLISVL